MLIYIIYYLHGLIDTDSKYNLDVETVQYNVH